MPDRTVRVRRNAIRAEYLDEEAEAAEAEGLENDQAVLSVRVPAALAETLRARSGRRARSDIGSDPADSGGRHA